MYFIEAIMWCTFDQVNIHMIFPAFQSNCPLHHIITLDHQFIQFYISKSKIDIPVESILPFSHIAL